MADADVLIVGGGIVGLATAYDLLQRRPETRVLLVEKETGLAQHQTGRNSGVLHSGIYYKPGSLKALNCRAGKLAMQEFCDREQLPYELCGKVVVAIEERELPALAEIHRRGLANGVPCEMIDRPRLAELEPHAAGVAALHVPETGIVDYPAVCQRLGQRIAQRGGRIVTGAKVTAIDQRGGERIVQTTAGAFTARWLVNCAGLHCDRVTRLDGRRAEAKIVPFRGEYFELVPAAQHLCRTLIYPVPDPNFPFLGVHFTRLIGGGVECGPNAVLAFAREGYRKRDVNVRDLAESLTYTGFLRLAARYWRTGAGEMWRSLSKRAFVRALQRLVPEIRAEHLVAAPAGVRAQAVRPDGAMVDDFLIQPGPGAVHVLNAPSPAATAALNVGRLIVDELVKQMAG